MKVPAVLLLLVLPLYMQYVDSETQYTPQDLRKHTKVSIFLVWNFVTFVAFWSLFASHLCNRLF